MQNIFRIISQTETQMVTKQDGTTTHKATLILQEIGGRTADSFACTLLGQAAISRFQPGDIVFANLRFQHREYNGNFYQDITIHDILKMNATLPSVLPLVLK